MCTDLTRNKETCEWSKAYPAKRFFPYERNLGCWRHWRQKHCNDTDLTHFADVHSRGSVGTGVWTRSGLQETALMHFAICQLSSRWMIVRCLDDSLLMLEAQAGFESPPFLFQEWMKVCWPLVERCQWPQQLLLKPGQMEGLHLYQQLCLTPSFWLLLPALVLQCVLSCWPKQSHPLRPQVLMTTPLQHTDQGSFQPLPSLPPPLHFCYCLALKAHFSSPLVKHWLVSPEECCSGAAFWVWLQERTCWGWS